MNLRLLLRSRRESFSLPPAPNDQPHRHHGAGHEEPHVLRLPEVVDVDVDDALVVEVVHHHGEAVVEEMHQHAGPQRTAGVEHITQHHAEEQARQEAVELEVDEREDGRREEDGDVGVHPARQALLQHAAEGELLAHGRDQGDDNQVDQQPADAVGVEQLLGGGRGGLLQRLDNLLDLLERRAEFHVLVPQPQLGGDGHRDEHQRNGDQQEERPECSSTSFPRI